MFLVFTTLFLLINFILFDLLELLSFDALYIFDDESDDDESGSGSHGTCAFPFCYGNSVGSVSGLGSGVFVLTVIESIDDVFPLVMLIPKGVEPKGGRLIELFWRPKS